ncbi:MULTISPECIES: tetratricopeptide repeat-containing sulfotransferase family protein [Pseudoalteromonas]|uniref:Protein-tyrosine sulfotransferase n=1 Tax=Pseudoalteromonas amylolytica TaxID=1859457 RepID=A0A1S1N0S9_9GAMM|nr:MULTISPECIES: sulfotransferase [Pseudoalteromonas]OHU85319.1 protein-tyrosine sulfotransferase [Pseudoalteromonas sp. JW3]OHU93059.1 protein-tyrosine sulfotransferase [Pseudoalteromonas amylolytica]
MLLIQRAYELMAENRLREAEFMFKAVLKENNNNGHALFGLGQLCIELADYDSAIYYLRRACENLPRELDPLFTLANCFVIVGSAVDAKTVLEYTLSIARASARAHYELGQFYLDHGFIDNARKTFEEGISCENEPVTPHIIYEAAQLSATSKLPSYVTKLEHLLEIYSNDQQLKVVIYYALGKCQHRLGNYQQAFDAFKMANDTQIQLCEFRTKDMLPFFTQLREHFSDTYFNQPTNKVTTTFTPTFIVGLPRTGSTLLEQMLIQHSNIGSIGECTVLSDTIVPFLAKRAEAPFPYCVSNLNTSVLDYCRNLYIDEIKDMRVGDEVVINKLPANFQNIGMIYKIFPNARFIHLTRNFGATAWSVFSNHFGANEPYFCSLTEFKLYAQAQIDMMEHFKKYIPQNIFTLSYEDLLKHPAKALNQTLHFLEQKFEPECLEFYLDKRSVSTLSKAQVRKPISKAPLTNWHHYEKYMSELLNDDHNAQTNLASP